MRAVWIKKIRNIVCLLALVGPLLLCRPHLQTWNPLLIFSVCCSPLVIIAGFSLLAGVLGGLKLMVVIVYFRGGKSIRFLNQSLILFIHF